MTEKEYIAKMLGRRFGRLIVIEHVGSHESRCGHKERMWKCRCDCGKEIVASGRNLRAGRYVSCGCAKTEQLRKASTTHGGAHVGHVDRLYHVWKGMKSRCLNPKNISFHRYGGRGITICDEWKNSYEAFRKWAFENGYDPLAPHSKCTIDRINNDGNYEPNNCRWVDMKVQANNTCRQKGRGKENCAD